MATHFRSHTSKRFREAFASLPPSIQEKARVQYARWLLDPFYPSLHFYCVRDNVWSVRVDDQYRALGVMEGEVMTWLWIWPHRGYENRI